METTRTTIWGQNELSKGRGRMAPPITRDPRIIRSPLPKTIEGSIMRTLVIQPSLFNYVNSGLIAEEWGQ